MEGNFSRSKFFCKLIKLNYSQFNFKNKRLICGVRVRVELSHGKSRHKGGPGFRQGRDDYRGGGGGGRRRSR